MFFSTGCNNNITQSNTGGDVSADNSYDGIVIEIVQPSVYSPEDKTSIEGFLLHSADLDNIQDELMSYGADEVTVMAEEDDKFVILSSPDDLQENETGNKVKIIAVGDYDELNGYTLQKENTHLADLKLLCDTFKITVNPYTDNKK